MKKVLFLAAVAAATTCSYGAGFGIYEASARGNAMGGAVVGDTHDATAAYHNPANLAFSTNIMVAGGFTLINPYCDVEVDHRSQDRMNPGWFFVPTFYASIPLPADFTFGWGNYTEFGLGTKYADHWDLAGDTQQTTMEQMSFNPNLSYKVTDRWAVAAGIRGSYILFNNHKRPYHGDSYLYDTGYGTLSAPDAYHLHSRLNGDDWGMGWNAATSFKVTEDVTVGLIYRSQIKHKIKGDFHLNGHVSGTMAGTLHNVPYEYAPGQYTVLPSVPTSQDFSQTIGARRRASAKLTLPESVTLGANWNVTPRYRVGSTITYTRWSSVNSIHFKIHGDGGYGYRQRFSWRDTVRVGFGMEYDFLDWLSGRIGYVFDEDPTRKSHESTMLPGGDRHIIGTGLGFKLTENLRLDLGYNFIRMNNEHYYVRTHDQRGNEQKRYVSCHNGFSHLVSATLSYSF